MQIKLTDLQFYAYHGVLPQEQIVGGDYRVSVCLTLSDSSAHAALYEDRLDATVNYADAYHVVRRTMVNPSALLENVAARIARTLLRTFKAVQRVDVSVTKLSPPIQGFDGAGATVCYTLSRRMVVWDFDGTLADTSQGIVRTMTATFQQMKWAVPSREAICQTIGLPLLQSIAQLSPQAEPQAVSEATNLYRELFEQVGTGGITLFDGIAEAVKSQWQGGFFTTIATSRGHQSVENLITMLGLAPYFDYIVACEDVGAHKPNPAPVLALCQQANVSPIDAVVIGDTTFDIEMGKNASVGCLVGVGWGNHQPKALLAAGANYIATTAKSLTASSLTEWLEANKRNNKF